MSVFFGGVLPLVDTSMLPLRTSIAPMGAIYSHNLPAIATSSFVETTFSGQTMSPSHCPYDAVTTSSDAEGDARIATEKVLESQEEEIVTKFSTMSVSDKIALGVYSNFSPPPPAFRKVNSALSVSKRAFGNFSNWSASLLLWILFPHPAIAVIRFPA